MTVAELIAHLQAFPPDLLVAYQIHSEYTLLDAEDVKIGKMHPPRADGWVGDYWQEDNPGRIDYVLFPGN